MVSALTKAIRLRSKQRARDMRITTSGCARTPPIGAAERASTTAPGLTAHQLIRMAQAARRTRGREDG